MSEAARKALSAVHRLGGRFGRGRLVDHLLGKTRGVSESESALSTWGIGAEFSPGGWRDLIDQLLFEGLLVEDPNDGRPVIGLSDPDAVRAIYRGERTLTVLRAPEHAGASRPRQRRSGSATPVAVDVAPLFESLRVWRREEAARQRVPPYVIFHDTTLADIARERPADRSALAAIGGVGQGKLERYGEAVLGLVGDAA